MSKIETMVYGIMALVDFKTLSFSFSSTVNRLSTKSRLSSYTMIYLYLNLIRTEHVLLPFVFKVYQAKKQHILTF